MNNNINELKKNYSKEGCSFCTHLSLESTENKSKYNIKCIIFDNLPKCNDACEYFEKFNLGI